jgi:hypothetical protein
MPEPFAVPTVAVAGTPSPAPVVAAELDALAAVPGNTGMQSTHTYACLYLSALRSTQIL